MHSAAMENAKKKISSTLNPCDDIQALLLSTAQQHDVSSYWFTRKVIMEFLGRCDKGVSEPYLKFPAASWKDRL